MDSAIMLDTRVAAVYRRTEGAGEASFVAVSSANSSVADYARVSLCSWHLCVSLKVWWTLMAEVFELWREWARRDRWTVVTWYWLDINLVQARDKYRAILKTIAVYIWGTRIFRIFLFSSQDRHIYIYIYSCRISIEFNSNFPISMNYSRLCVTI